MINVMELWPKHSCTIFTGKPKPPSFLRLISHDT